ncbi:MAG: hypothetical protein JWP50_2167 [Phenylobacterium sp.]|nr:hypothetical protein [Phenylobacterium sp.]
MTAIREPFDAWEPPRPRLGPGVIMLAIYWLGAALSAARAYELAFHRYQPLGAPAGADNGFALTVARDAGLWAATATAGGAFLLFLAILMLRQVGGRLLWAARSRRSA